MERTQESDDDRDEPTDEDLREREPGEHPKPTPTTSVETGLPWCPTCEHFAPPERDEDRTGRCPDCGTAIEWVEGEL